MEGVEVEHRPRQLLADDDASQLLAAVRLAGQLLAAVSIKLAEPDAAGFDLDAAAERWRVKASR